jgi:hypothetical protein
MWTLILFKYVLYRLNLNRYLSKKINTLLKGKRIFINRSVLGYKQKKQVLKKTKNIKNRVHTNVDTTYLPLSRHSVVNSTNILLSSLKSSYFKLLLNFFLNSKKKSSFH